MKQESPMEQVRLPLLEILNLFYGLSLLKTWRKTDILPFRGKLNLPSREQVIKLVLFTKQLPGNYHKSKTVIAQLVCDQILIYWNMANFATLTKQIVCNKIIKEWNEYQNINKNKRETERELNVKRTYKDNLTVSILLFSNIKV